jgi:uncharacterized membrane protein YfcA
MRGGAIPLLIWASLLAASGTLNAIWTGDDIQIEEFAGAVLITLLTAAVLIARRREAVQRGEPTAPDKPEPVTHASFAVVIGAIGFAAFLFGFVFGHFFIYFGLGLMVAALGRLGNELYHEWRALHRSDA